MHQMRLAQAGTAIEQQRVVRTPRIISHLYRRGLAELVRFAFDERIKGVVRIQIVIELLHVDGYRSTGSTLWLARSKRTDFAAHFYRSIVEPINDLSDARQVVGAHNVQGISVWSKQPQAVCVLQRLQRHQIGVQVLDAELALEPLQAASPRCTQ